MPKKPGKIRDLKGSKKVEKKEASQVKGGVLNKRAQWGSPPPSKPSSGGS